MLVLASESPRRKELLRLITAEFETAPSAVEEEAIQAGSPPQLAQLRARAKALAVAKNRPQDTVIGCDTVVEAGGRLLGKPRDRGEARGMLLALSGRGHLVHTGVCVVHRQTAYPFTATTRVFFAPLDPEEIEQYISTDEPYDKAGGYGIQGGAARFVTGIEGCYYNVMGLPVQPLYRLLRQLAAADAAGATV